MSRGRVVQWGAYSHERFRVTGAVYCIIYVSMNVGFIVGAVDACKSGLLLLHTFLARFFPASEVRVCSN